MLHSVAYLLLGKVGDGPAFQILRTIWAMPPPQHLGGDCLGEDYG